MPAMMKHIKQAGLDKGMNCCNILKDTIHTLQEPTSARQGTMYKPSKNPALTVKKAGDGLANVVQAELQPADRSAVSSGGAYQAGWVRQAYKGGQHCHTSWLTDTFCHAGKASAGYATSYQPWWTTTERL